MAQEAEEQGVDLLGSGLPVHQHGLGIIPQGAQSGALDEPADGAVLVFKGDDATPAEDFAKHDPYVINGLITQWQVRPWTVVIGD